MERVRRFNESRNEVVVCHCQTGWLDSPLALMAHASAFPTATNTFRGSRKRSFGDMSLLPFPSLSVAPTGGTIATAAAAEGIKVVRKAAVAAAPTGDDAADDTDDRCSGGVEDAIFTVRPLYLPNGHPPLSREVYEHLRFGEHYDLDERMKAFNVALKTDDVEVAAKKAFQCPLCLSHEASRWALTEHAFFSHWLRLCYVCCHHICEAGTRKGGEQSIWEHTFSCLNQRHAALLLCANNNEGDNVEGVDDDPGWRRRWRHQQGLCPQEETKATVFLSSPPRLDATATAATVFDDGRFADPPSGKCAMFLPSLSHIGVAAMETDDACPEQQGVGILTGCNNLTAFPGAEKKQHSHTSSALDPIGRKAPRLGSALIG
ncbi:hypothetical protein TSMEX_003367 [Taenia solium]|eukprot:TsM_000808900 transcript=TsM_000808900 gene=TsM_000808900